MRARGQFQWAGLVTERGGASLPGVPPSSPAAWAAELTRARAQPEVSEAGAPWGPTASACSDLRGSWSLGRGPHGIHCPTGKPSTILLATCLCPSRLTCLF